VGLAQQLTQCIPASDSWEEDFLFFFCYINLYRTMPLRAWPFVIPRTSFEQTWISLPQRCSMPNIVDFPSQFRTVVYGKIFEDLSKFCPLKRSVPLFEQIWIPIPQACFPPSLVEIGQVVLDKKSFKGKS